MFAEIMSVKVFALAQFQVAAQAPVLIVVSEMLAGVQCQCLGDCTSCGSWPNCVDCGTSQTCSLSRCSTSGGGSRGLLLDDRFETADHKNHLRLARCGSGTGGPCFHHSTIFSYHGLTFDGKSLGSTVPCFSVDVWSIGIEIFTDNGSRLQLTPAHFIFVDDDRSLIHAADLSVGDFVFVSDQGGATTKVVNVSNVDTMERYLDLQCESSIILANGIRASVAVDDVSKLELAIERQKAFRIQKK